MQAGDEDGRASLHKAAYAGHPNICQLLLDNGADAKTLSSTSLPPTATTTATTTMTTTTACVCSAAGEGDM